ncbi:hypothetical protein CWI38_0073p0020 [Hamiltosporidium tvaerminnensis]|uniref:Uncharacterized protein n=2 Tax=Hamiltosporidium TaxID=1176354 RepID=A0A4Q9LMM0_9MICR|nr:hypothetical protein LUQ84_001555 [Hamiltosporidium tvaerminnensis]TBU08745.1 hypothetical protein CWI39_0145p0030 [Hamiltosporidium magnivora]TBU05534.1 hypothetical protein CWI37_0003p0070 [Hamiltosporidium tvaerminnensis]TBU09669.1 hypothetical protein CWI36_0010p0030 [Hamiltosporidium magnivora]TBU09697.1 hypothetical protein CWI36_0007p0030 [Hamiltosporidium magnivora]
MDILLKRPYHMDDRIRKLKKMRIFDLIEVSKFGHGSFIRKNKESRSSTIIDINITEAHKLKKDADKIIKNDHNEAVKLYVKSLFRYIRGFVEVENEKSCLEAIKGWKSLCMFITSICSLMNVESDSKYLAMFQYVLYIVKYHYLALESSIVLRKVKGTKDVNFNKDFLYFLTEYTSLHEISSLSRIKNFNLVSVKNLEEFVKSDLEFIVGENDFHTILD